MASPYDDHGSRERRHRRVKGGRGEGGFADRIRSRLTALVRHHKAREGSEGTAWKRCKGDRSKSEQLGNGKNLGKKTKSQGERKPRKIPCHLISWRPARNTKREKESGNRFFGAKVGQSMKGDCVSSSLSAPH